MKLPFLQKKEEQKKEYLLALLVRPASIGAILFEEIDKNLSILSTSDENYSQGIAVASSEELIELSDNVISKIEVSLPENTNLTKTIFAVPYDWILDGKIKKEYLLRLKKVCDELELTPIGFIISAEAIIAYLQKKQGAPLSSIFVEISGETVYVYLVKAGNIVEVKTEHVDESAVKTVEALLAGVESFEVLPSKIVLFDHEGAQKTNHEFLAHHWNKDLAFLHTPNVEVLARGFENEAIIHGVASQMGFDVLDPETIKEKKEEEEIENNNFGFVREKDIAEIAEAQQVEEAEAAIPHMKHHDNLQAVDENVMLPKITPPQKNEEELDDEEYNKLEGKKNIFAGLLSLTSFIKMPKKLLPMPKLPLPQGKLLLIIPVIILILLLAGGYFYYANLEKAEVIITTNQKTIQKEIAVSLSPDSATSVGNKVIGMKILSTDIDGTDSGAASGKKDTGDRSKGTVTIYNKTDSPKSFPKGTIVTSTNNLKFDLANDVTVASTSAFSTNISSTDVQVAGDNFGQEYNMPSGTNFSFKDYSTSDYFAKNSSAFAGGTKRSVTTITQKDLDALGSALQDSLKSKAISQAQGQIGGDTGILSDPLSIDFSKKKFDKKVGDEGDKVNLAATVTFKFGTYKKADVVDIAKSASTPDVPSGYTFVEGQSHEDLKDVKVNKDNKVDAKIASNALYTADLPTDKLAQEISGKTDAAVIKKLQENPNVASVVITFQNKIPFLPSILPLNAGHITITVRAQ